MLRDRFGFNFWPSFTDLMLSFVLVVLIVLFVVSKMIAAGTENLDRARQSQQKIQAQLNRELGNIIKLLCFQIVMVQMLIERWQINKQMSTLSIN
jgi:uncharacterized membrane protein